MIRFYIAEDDKLIREGLRDCFPWEDVGARVVGSAEDGKTALEAILSLNVDVVLTDVVMPGMSGIELARALNDAGWQGEILMMSAYQDVGYVRSALKVRAVDFLFKPVQSAELMAGIKSAIERSLARARNERYDEQTWLDKAGSAAVELDDARLEEALAGAFSAMRAGERGAHAARMLEFVSENVGLQRAERRLIKAAEALRGETNEALIASAYTGAVKELIDELRRSPREWRFASRVSVWIRENLRRADAGALARELNMSRASFYRQFAQCFDDGLNEYILKARMRAAMAMLSGGDMKVYEVADSVGYTDVDYFTRLFKQHTSYLPSEYKAENPRKGRS